VFNRGMTQQVIDVQPWVERLEGKCEYSKRYETLDCKKKTSVQPLVK
jgi:hypothetical protein